MKRTGIWFVAALALCLLAGCVLGQPEEDDGGMKLYFVDSTESAFGSALRGETYQGVEDPGVDTLVYALLEGPTEDGLRSPIPRQVTLRSWKLGDGLLTLDLSEHYGDLSGVELTLADYCITLTLCQLEGVDAVLITAAGHTLNYRGHQVLTPDEVMQSGMIEEPEK